MSSLKLVDIEDFVPILQLSKYECSLDDKYFVEKQYKAFLQITSDKAAIDHYQYRKYEKFCTVVLGYTTNPSEQKNKIRRSYLYNLIFHKYQYDIQGIKAQNVFNNYYFGPEDNGIIKQLFIAVMQILLTALLLFDIIESAEEVEYDNSVSVPLAICIAYLAYNLIEPQISSIVGDLEIIKTYFHISKINVLLNIFTNIVIALLLPLVTYFVILTSETMTDIVLNATAVSFIIELDDIGAIEIDLENWFLQSGAGFSEIFRKMIPFNNPIVTQNKQSLAYIHDQLSPIITEVKNSNTKSEYLSVSKWKICVEILTDLLYFIGLPILILQHPYNIILFFCKNDTNQLKKIDFDEDEKVNAQNTEKDENISGNKGYKKIKNNRASIISSNNDMEEFKYENDTKDVESIETKDVEYKYNEDNIEQALILNNEGNDFMKMYRFSDACDKYAQAIQITEKLAHYCTAIFCYNAAYAFYSRGKQSWISETVTNRYGHSYTNYKEAVGYVKKCIKICKTNALRDKNRIRINLCNLLMTDIFIAMFDFNQSFQYYEEYYRNNKGATDITKYKKIKSLSDIETEYLKILDEFRRNAFESGDNELDVVQDLHNIDNVVQDVNEIIKTFSHDENNRNDKLFDLFDSTEFSELKGKFYSIRSDYYSRLHVGITERCKRLKHDIDRLDEAIEKTEPVEEETEETDEKTEKKTKEQIQKEKDLKEKSEKNRLEKRERLLKEKSEKKTLLQETERLWEEKPDLMKNLQKNALNDAAEAADCSNLYAWKQFTALTFENVSQDKQLCERIISEYTNQIEFDSKQSYYYYIRGRVYYKLSVNIIEKKEYYLSLANKDFKSATNLEAGNTLFWLRLRQTQLGLKEYDNAIQSEQKAKQCDDYVTLENLILANTKSGILSAYYDASLKDDEEGMSKREYRRFLARLDRKTRGLFESLGSFDKLAGNDSIIDLHEFEELMDKVILKQSDELMLEHCDNLNGADNFFEAYDYVNKVETDEISSKYVDPNSKNKPPQAFAEFYESIGKELCQHIRDILMRTQETAEFFDDCEGLSEEEYERWKSMLPRKLMEMFDWENDITFERYCGDGVMDFEEFATMVDYMGTHISKLVHQKKLSKFV